MKDTRVEVGLFTAFLTVIVIPVFLFHPTISSLSVLGLVILATILEYFGIPSILFTDFILTIMKFQFNISLSIMDLLDIISLNFLSLLSIGLGFLKLPEIKNE